MTGNARLRIGKVTFKAGHEKPGRTFKAFIREGDGCFSEAYFVRTSSSEWRRLTLLEYVRLIR